jgi:hypothetical protein
MFHMNARLVGLYYSFTDWDGMYFFHTLRLLNGTLTRAGLESRTHSWTGDANIALYAIAAVQAWAHIGHGQNRRRITWPLLAPAANRHYGRFLEGMTSLSRFAVMNHEK